MAEKKFDIVVVGSIFMDFFCYADRLPTPGETLIGTDFKTGFGGKGGNQCVAAQRLGSRTAFIGKIGNDNHGEQYYAHFIAEGVNVDCIVVDNDFPTGATSIMVGTNDGQNMIIPVPGATGEVNVAFIEKPLSEETIRSSKILLCQLEISTEASLAALKLGKAHGLTTIWNVAPGQVGLPVEMFGLADILCLNETEAELITGISISNITQAKEAAEKLVIDFSSRHVIITLGSEGALLRNGDSNEFHIVKAPKVSPVLDTTGAGDCFVGTLAHCLGQGDNLLEATEKATRNASQSVLIKGTQTSYPHEIVKE